MRDGSDGSDVGHDDKDDKGKPAFFSKAYAHFDRPLSREKVTALLSAPQNVARHAFWPLILDPVMVVSRKTEIGQNGQRRWSRKPRPIALAAHVDAHIHAHYAGILSQRLEARYAAAPALSRAVLAYRRFESPRCNVHFALEAFEEIRQRGACDVLALDIRSFFDHLSHRLLKKAWKEVLGCDSMPEDHYAVFKAVTQSPAITVSALRDIFGGEIRRRTGQTGARICSTEAFRQRVAPLLRPLPELVSSLTGRAFQPGTGIPQGIAISTVLANLYMLATDELLLAELGALGGSYRRYSDDILVILPTGQGAQAEERVKEAVAAAGLEIHDGKTRRYRFSTAEGNGQSFQLDAHWQIVDRGAVSYLGLSDDGQAVRIRDSTISRFMEKATGAVERAHIAAARRNDPHLRKRLLYTRLTRLGYGQAYGAHFDPSGILPKGAPRLGFFKYLKLVERVTQSPAVRKQAAQLENRVHRLIALHEALLQKELQEKAQKRAGGTS